MIAIRPFQAVQKEYEALVRVQREIWKYPYSSDLIALNDKKRDPRFLFERYTLLQEGNPAGFGTLFERRESYEPGVYGFSILVSPAYRRQGIGSSFYDFALRSLAGRKPQPIRLVTESREDQEDALAFLHKRGFEITMRFPRSILETDRFDASRFDRHAGRVARSGIEISSLADIIAADPEGIRHFYELSELQIMPDVPNPGEYKPRTFELFVDQLESSPRISPEMIFVALDGEQQVGLSTLFPQAVGSSLWMTGLTGVKRAYRRRGIALTLKVAAITFAREMGAEQIETDNEENNPMVALNLRLGFEPQPAWLDLERPFTTKISQS